MATKKPYIPQKINILGADYSVSVAKNLSYESDKVDGFCSPQKREIWLDEECDAMQTFLHECFHGVLQRAGVHGNISEDIEEVIVDTIATFMTERFNVKCKR